MPEESRQPESLSDSMREIKGSSIEFKGTLSGPLKPWEVEFQRQNLRRHIVQALFKYPSAPQADRLENMLWLETSHAVIVQYRALLKAMDDKLAEVYQFDTPQPKKRQFKRGEDGPVARRKLITRFRSFLSEEEAFWGELVIRAATTFDLTQASGPIAALSLSHLEPAELASRKEDVVRGSISRVDSPVSEPITTITKHKKLLFIQKCLISLGDLSRYREQSSERPRAGMEGGGPARSGGRRRANIVSFRLRDYSRAFECYKQAKLLAPSEGNPSNQLAILALYGGDTFSALMHYYRALCARNPFVTSRENLKQCLEKALQAYRKDRDDADKQNDYVLAFQRDVVALHGLWHLKPSNPKVIEQGKLVVTSFSKLLESRSLAPDVVIRVVTLALGALWIFQVFKPSSQEPQAISTEHQITAHITSLFKTVFKIAYRELKEASSAILNTQLAQSISATLRRTLPCLHVISRWIKINTDVIHPCGTKNPQMVSSSHCYYQFPIPFWSSYATFLNRLLGVFPLKSLPVATVRFEEDEDLRGFRPLEGTSVNDPTPSSPCASPSTVHPNDEHLMRIRDVISSGLEIANQEVSVLNFVGGKFVAQEVSGSPDSTENIPLPSALGGGRDFPALDEGDSEDEIGTVSTEDPVGLAMKATLMEDESDDEQVLYPRLNSGVPPSGGTAMWTVSAFPPPLSTAPRSPKAASTTAEDLLSRVLNQNVAPSPLQRASATLDSGMNLGSSGYSGLVASSPHSPSQAPASSRARYIGGAPSPSLIHRDVSPVSRSLLRYSGSFRPPADDSRPLDHFDTHTRKDIGVPLSSSQSLSPDIFLSRYSTSTREMHAFGPIGSPRLRSNAGQSSHSSSQIMPNNPAFGMSQFVNGHQIHSSLNSSLPAPAPIYPWT
ncbi:uncharacterized protein EI90DRAFT_3138368 [Cantharellus anzutake]|uniref:uncharacterized protein n=1 Tax=Cantharellus anzutake TaxID=1750568 RepID=UPI001902E881|nr:uncharacterized protein EI90DRAFT_3138368 [Cantharellus anzutake]KAF8311529.1 hypothetical protein EI90DRAFT_3138368 [Cantharellus anzutake]